MKTLKFKPLSEFYGGSIFGCVKRTVIDVPASANDVYGQWDGNRNAFSFSENTGTQWFAGKQRCRLTADLSASTSTTLADVTGLVFPVLANLVYAFEFTLFYQTAATTTGIKLALTAPSGFTTLSAVVDIYGRAADGSSGSVFSGTLINVAASDSVVSDQVEAANTTYPAVVAGVFVNGANAGNLQLQWATEVAASGVTPKKGSFGELWLE